MVSVIDVNERYLSSKKKHLRNVIFFIVISVLCVSGILILLFTSKDNYTLNMILAILVALFYSWYALFYLINLCPLDKAKFLFYKNYNATEVESFYGTYLKDKEEKLVRKLMVKPFEVTFVNQGRTYFRDVYLPLDLNIDLESDKQYKFYVYQNMLIKYEEVL